MSKGVARMVEAMISSVMIISAFTVGYYLLTPPSPSHVRNQQELQEFGYNLLSTLESNNGFDTLLFDSKGNQITGWEQQFKVVASSLISPNMIFDIVVYNATYDSQRFILLVKLNLSPISNVLDGKGNVNTDAFIRAGENAQISTLYTTKKNWILVITMQLAEVGGV